LARRATVILPGVGAADDDHGPIARTRPRRTDPQLTQPVLGICLGMQLLFARSEEGDEGNDTECSASLPSAWRASRAGTSSRTSAHGLERSCAFLAPHPFARRRERW